MKPLFLFHFFTPPGLVSLAFGNIATVPFFWWMADAIANFSPHSQVSYSLHSTKGWKFMNN